MHLPHVSRVFSLWLALSIGFVSVAHAAPSHEEVDSYLNHYVSLTLETGERFNAALYTRSEGHVVLKRDDGQVESLAIRHIASIAPPYTEADKAQEDAAFEIEQDAYIQERDETHDQDAAKVEGAPAPTADNEHADAEEDAQQADTDEADASDDEHAAAEDVEDAEEEAEETTDAPTDSETDDALAAQNETSEDAAEDAEDTEDVDFSYAFNALDRRVLDEELRSLMHKQELQREVDRTARGLVIGGSAVIGVHVAIQGLLLIPMLSKDSSMSSRTAKVLSGVNVPFLLMGGSLLAAGLVQRDRARKEFQERYNFSVAPAFYKDGAGAQMRLVF